MKKDIAILVMSCDKYSDLWHPFLSQFDRYFPSNVMRVYVGSNTIACNEPGVVPILSGDDRDWSFSYKRILEQIEERKIAVILEDFLLASPVNVNLLSEVLDFMFASNAKHVKYWPSPTPDKPTDHVGIGQYARCAPYRATVCGLWDREYLTSLLLEGESSWDFEIMGSYRTSYEDGFFGLNTPLFEFKNLIEKGCWIPQSVDWAKKEGVMLDLSKRPLLKGARQIKSRLQMAYFQMMIKMPWQRRVRWMNTLRKLVISY